MIEGFEGATPALLAGVTLVTLIGATLQGVVGFGMGMFAVPILLLIDPAFVPGPTLATMALLTLAMTHRDRHAVRVRDLKWAVGGRLFGIGGALAFLTFVPADTLAPVLGGLILLAVALSVSGLHIRPGPGTLTGAGLVSGFMGTTVSIGGPPVALLYQHESGPEVRGTLSAYFMIGIALSIAGLVMIGRFELAELQLTMLLLPGTAAGFLLSRRVAPLLDRGYTRRAILVLAAIMGVLVIAKYALTRPAVALRVVTYNIRHGRGMDDRLDLVRTAAVLRRLDADVIGLQEVDRRTERAAGVDQADSLAALLGMHRAFGSFMPYQGGEYGMAILSRFPVRGATPIALPEGNEPRIALAVDLDLPDGTSLRVVNVHFDWVADDAFRYNQALVLAGHLDTVTVPLVLLGDFNDTPESRSLRLFASRLDEAAKPRTDRFTFSSTEPVREIDYVFVGPRATWSVRLVRVIAEAAASDHRPVLVVLSR